MSTWSYVAVGLLAGMLLPVQAGINAALSPHVGSPVRAALVSFVVGTVGLLLVWLAFARGWPSLERLGAAPWWVWTGGLLGAVYVATVVVVAPKLGAVALVTVLLAGQAVASLALDQFGWVGYAQHAITPGRVAGIAFVAVGVALVRLY